MTLPSRETIAKAAAEAARRHWPKGFSADVDTAGQGDFWVTVRYCWKDSPRFEVEAEVYLAAEEVAEAVGQLEGARTGKIDYLEDHVCRFGVSVITA